MFDYQTWLDVIQDDRRREIAAAARARLAPGKAPGRGRPFAAPARRGVGRMLVRLGVWLAMSGAPSTFQG